MEVIDSFGLVGATVADKYLVEAVIDAGGTAVVYRATHVLMDRRVALKVFRVDARLDDAARTALVDRFVLEGRVLAELSERSSAIVQSRDVGTFTAADGTRIPYMVLEWLEGETLEHVLEREMREGAPPRSLEAAVRLLDPIASSLGLAHRRGIVHRDVKPSNLFLVGDPRAEPATVKLLDFGIAKVVEDARAANAFGMTDVHVLAFTPAYGAPEQFSRALGTTGPWTDVFALALVLLEIVSGRAPLAGETIEELGAASTRGSVRPTMPGVGKAPSPGAEKVFARAMSVEPSRRYASVEAFWAELKAAIVEDERALHALDTTATLPDPVQVIIPRRSQRRLWVAASFAVLVAVIATGAIAAQRTRIRIARPVARVAALGPSASVSAPALVIEKPCPEEMAAIPGGQYFMGSDEADVEDHERPAHKVRLARYCIDKTEVTVAAYGACAAAGACPGAWDGNRWAEISKQDQSTYDPLCNAHQPNRLATHPANCVSWAQARDFCVAQGKRLPTEAEWEHAARGSDGRRFPWGDAEPTAKRLNACGSECVAWGRRHRVELTSMYREDDGWPTTAPVGSFPDGASPFGVLDMTGNVWEWVSDRYAAYDPKDERDPRGPSEGAENVVRGGAWNGSEGAWVRPTYRFHSLPDTQSHGIGFRCAL